METPPLPPPAGYADKNALAWSISPGTHKAPVVPEEDAQLVADDYYDADVPVYTALQLQAYSQRRVEAERERCATLISSGDYCRYVDHIQGCCDCVEMAAAIRKP